MTKRFDNGCFGDTYQQNLSNITLNAKNTFNMYCPYLDY